MSQKRKMWLRNNPDKHPWRKNTKFKSKPCEIVKLWLKENNISFIEEFVVNVNDHTYSIDIAFPDKKIGIEINGNQHYNRDGTLAPYYHERDVNITNSGWELIQLHYSICYNIEKIKYIFDNISNSNIKQEFDYQQFLINNPNKRTKENFCIDCNKNIALYSTRCRSCSSIHTQSSKRKRCSKETLSTYLQTMTISEIARLFHVSWNSIKDWCVFYGLR